MHFVESRRHCEALSYISLTCFIQRRQSLKFYFSWRRKILKVTKFKNSNSSFKVCRRDENVPQTSTNIWAHLRICSNINYLPKVNLPPAVMWQNRSRAVVMFGRIKVAMVTAALREDRRMSLWFSDSCSHKEKKKIKPNENFMKNSFLNTFQFFLSQSSMIRNHHWGLRLWWAQVSEEESYSSPLISDEYHACCSVTALQPHTI